MTRIRGVEKWVNSEGQLHREIYPAQTTYFQGGRRGTEKEEWFINGVPYRENDLPAVVIRHETFGGTVAREHWFKDGVLGRDGDKPSVVSYYSGVDHRKQEEEWYINGQPGREGDQPFNITYYDAPGNRVRTQFWKTKNIRYYDTPGSERIESEYYPLNENSEYPSHVVRFNNPDNRVSTETWFSNSKISRAGDRPAVVKYFDSPEHRVNVEEWLLEDKPYRKGDRPTRVTYYEDGKVQREEWIKGNDAWRSNWILHRVTGPAIIDYNPDGTVQSGRWYVDGKEVTEAYLMENFCAGAAARKEVPRSESNTCRLSLTIEGKHGYFDELIRLCDTMEETEVSPSFLSSTVRVLQAAFPLSKRLSITTTTGNEVLACLPYRWDIVSHIPQETTGLGKLKITYRDQPGIDYGGLSRQFFSALYQQIWANLFTEIDLDDDPYFRSQKRYRPGTPSRPTVPRFTITNRPDSQIRAQLRVPESTSVEDLFELAGNLACFAVINGLPFTTPLSRYLLHRMLGGSDSEQHRMVSYIIDSGKILDLDYSKYMKYAVEAGIVDEDDNLTEEEKDRQVMEHLVETIRENSQPAYDPRRLEAFLRGFEPVGMVLNSRKITVDELHRLLYQDEISRGDMESLLNRVRFENFTPEAEQLVREAILNIGDYRQLLKWWTGAPYILNEQSYKIQLTDVTTVLDDGTRVKTDFASHTCFFTFDVDREIIESPGFLKEFRLEIRNERTTAV